MSIEINRTTAILSSFLGGVVVTLLATGSIKTHFNPPAFTFFESPMASQNVPIRQSIAYETTPTPIVTTSNPTMPPPAPPIANETSVVSELGLAAKFKTMLVDQSASFKLIDDNVTIEEAREQVYTALADMKSIKQGQGSNSIYVLFDPLCPHCHTLYKKMAGGWATSLDLTVNWIPAIAFLENNESVLISQRLITALNADKQVLSSTAWSSLINGDTSLVLSEEWLTTDQAFLDLAKNTMTLIQIGGGTPAVIFKTAKGDVEIINGVPKLDDFATLLTRD
jgi:hypothetical protein